MITPTQMYWLVKLDDMRHALTCIKWFPIVVTFAIAFAVLAAFVEYAGESRELQEKLADGIRRGCVWCVFLLLVIVVLQIAVAFIPSTKQMAAIIIVPKIANSEKVQTVGNKLYDLAVEWMKELEPRKDNAK